MLIEFVATIACGIGAAGIAMALRVISGKRVPGWAVPISAGVAMLGFTLWSEYTWFDRTTAALPESVAVVQSYTHKSSFRPWTYVVPMTDRFSAVDRAALRRNANVEGQVMAELLLISRQSSNGSVPVLIDCAARRRGNIADGAEFDDQGRVIGAEWTDLDEGDPLLGIVCEPA